MNVRQRRLFQFRRRFLDEPTPTPGDLHGWLAELDAAIGGGDLTRLERAQAALRQSPLPALPVEPAEAPPAVETLPVPDDGTPTITVTAPPREAKEVQRTGAYGRRG